jgi:hypothetical protein
VLKRLGGSTATSQNLGSRAVHWREASRFGGRGVLTPILYPALADVCRLRVDLLHETLPKEEVRIGAIDIHRSHIEQITVVADADDHRPTAVQAGDLARPNGHAASPKTMPALWARAVLRSWLRGLTTHDFCGWWRAWCRGLWRRRGHHVVQWGQPRCSNLGDDKGVSRDILRTRSAHATVPTAFNRCGFGPILQS